MGGGVIAVSWLLALHWWSGWVSSRPSST